MSTLPRPACCSADGESYERSSITSWLQEHGAVSPRTGLPLDSTCLVPVPSLRVLIQTVLRQAASSEAGRVISIATASPSITDSSSAAASKSSAACACASAASAASFSLALARSLLPPEALHVEGGAASFGGGSSSDRLGSPEMPRPPSSCLEPPPPPSAEQIARGQSPCTRPRHRTSRRAVRVSRDRSRDVVDQTRRLRAAYSAAEYDVYRRDVDDSSWGRVDGPPLQKPSPVKDADDYPSLKMRYQVMMHISEEVLSSHDPADPHAHRKPPMAKVLRQGTAGFPAAVAGLVHVHGVVAFSHKRSAPAWSVEGSAAYSEAQRRRAVILKRRAREAASAGTYPPPGATSDDMDSGDSEEWRGMELEEEGGSAKVAAAKRASRRATGGVTTYRTYNNYRAQWWEA